MKYVGKCQYTKKACSWQTYLGSGVYLKRAIKKYGRDNFYKIIIDEANTEEELREIEEYYIEMFNAVQNDNFYNLKDSSMGGNTWSTDEAEILARKQKLSSITSGKNNPMYGRAKTEKMINAVKLANSKKVVVKEKDQTLHFNSKTEMLYYYIDVIETSVEYDKNAVKNLKRSLQLYLENKENNIVTKTSKNSLKSIKQRIDQIISITVK